MRLQHKRIESDLSNLRNVEVTISHTSFTSAEKNEFRSQLSEIFAILERKHTDGREKVKALEDMVYIVRTLEDQLGTLDMNEQIAKQLRHVLTHRSTYMRAAAVRVMRHCCRDPSFPIVCWRLYFHYFLTRVVCMDKKHDREKNQVILLLRQLVKNKKTAEETPVLMLRGLVAMAENVDETFRIEAVEVIRDFAIQCPKLAAAANGIKCLVDAVLNPVFADIADTITQTLVYLLEAEPQRNYLRPKYDLQHLFSPVTEFTLEGEKSGSGRGGAGSNNNQSSTPTLVAQWNMSCDAIQLMMKSWTGLIAISNADKSFCGITSIVDALKLPGKCNDELREILFDTIIRILRGSAPRSLYDLIPPLSTDKKLDDNISHLNVLKKTDSLTAALLVNQRQGNISTSFGDNILLVFLAMTISSFIHHGLVDCLLALSKWTRSPRMSSRASQILQAILIFADMLLDARQCLRIHDGFDARIAYEHEMEKAQRTLAQRNKTLSTLTKFEHHTRKIRKDKTIRMDNVKTMVDTSMDDQHFNHLIRDSLVLVHSHKDWQKWNWETIGTLIHGPLRIPNRQQESLKTRLCKRMISFFKPLKKQFSEMPYNENSMKIAMLGSQFIENMLATEVGCNFLRSSGFLDELLQALNIELSHNPESSSNRIFSEEKVAYTMSREYFTFVGTFSAYPQGVHMLEKSKIFPVLERLATSRDDICQLIIKTLDYNNTELQVSNPARMILKTAMLSGSNKIRYFSTLRMRKLFRECAKDFHLWGIELLNAQLNDKWSEVAKNALKILSEACVAQSENLDALIDLKPSIEMLERQSEGRLLMLRMLSRPKGLSFLKEAPDWLNKSFAEWRDYKNLRYVERIEATLNKTMRMSKGDRKIANSASFINEDGIRLPPHFYGEICKSEEGCAMVADRGDFAMFVQQMTAPESDMLTRRQALWTLGQIGSSDCGFDAFFVSNDVLDKISDMAQDADSLSLRGTCMYVLSVMANSSHVRQRLGRCGWSFHIQPESNITIAVPKDPTRFFSIPSYRFEGSMVNTPDTYTRRHHELNHMDAHSNDVLNNIWKQVTQLLNPVMEAGATRELKKLKSQHQHEFTNARTLFHVLFLLSKYRFNLRTRKLILVELFANAQFSQADFDYIDQQYQPIPLYE